MLLIVDGPWLPSVFPQCASFVFRLRPSVYEATPLRRLVPGWFALLALLALRRFAEVGESQRKSEKVGEGRPGPTKLDEIRKLRVDAITRGPAYAKWTAFVLYSP